MPATDSPSTPALTPNPTWAIAVGLSSLYGVPMLYFIGWFVWADRAWDVAAIVLGTPVLLGGVCGVLLPSLPSVVVSGLVVAVALGLVGASVGEGATALSVYFCALAASPLYLLTAWPFQVRWRRRAGGSRGSESIPPGGGAALVVGLVVGTLLAWIPWLAAGVPVSVLFLPIQLASLASAGATGAILGYCAHRSRGRRSADA
jgi:hypothetical protein